MTASMLMSTFETVVISLVLLLGMAAGILVINRNLKKIGALMVAGFLLLALEPAVKFVVYQFILPNLKLREAMFVVPWYGITACISTLVNVAGLGCLLAAIYFAIQPRLQEGKNSNPPSSQPGT